MKKEKKQINILLIGYVVALVISGATAMVVPEGIRSLHHTIPTHWTIIYQWIHYVFIQLEASPKFLLYGYDWLAFAHYAIAVSFYGVWKDPVKNKWVIEWAMIVSILIFPLAFIMGFLRDIPFWWQLIDCSFGIVSLIPLLMIHRRIEVLEKEELEDCKILKYF